MSKLFDCKFSFLHANIDRSVLDIDLCLQSGQAFRWRKSSDGVWLGAIGDCGVTLLPGDNGFDWQTFPELGRWQVIESYFALDVPLHDLYADWVQSEPRIAPSLQRFEGLRVLRQEPDEVVFAFLCASCNTIRKISRSVSSLAQRYGKPIPLPCGETVYQFPKAEQISMASAEDLREDLWGFRAQRLIKLAGHIAEQGDGWWAVLRDADYQQSHNLLEARFGIGAKIADCICLFALGHDGAVPVDTHVRQVATRLFDARWVEKSLTPVLYDTISSAFRERFGPYAGWAQQYLFLEDM